MVVQIMFIATWNFKKHEENGCRKKYKPLTEFFLENNDENAIIKAEMLFTHFVIEHNMQIASIDHAGRCFQILRSLKSKAVRGLKHLLSFNIM